MFSEAVRAYLAAAFSAPTAIQEKGWPVIAGGGHALLSAPTGSGKTLAAFLSCIDELGAGGGTGGGYRVLYISPLKALAYDIEKNLCRPIAAIAEHAAALGAPFFPPRISVRTGDTAAADRRRQKRCPGDILVTTPESLFLLLTSAARETLRTVTTVIVDEAHAVAGTKRGAHLALSLERLAAITTCDPQRIGLSATARPLAEVARFVGGDRPVTIVDAGARPALDLHIESSAAGDALGAQLLARITAARQTIVFVNSRRMAEKLA
ncbi:MAG TPA: DEAD/DEAH box helicase, partial [Kofleriaceae bacterium]|nr:DEAD/DEAH box helicase [Kofleriaceae bacterium]